MIALIHKLGYRVVAEGVETEEVLDLLARWGCDEVQGYLFARPMDAPSLDAWLAEGRGPEPARMTA